MSTTSCSPRLHRGLKSAVSVVALLVGATVLQASSASAGDVRIDSNAYNSNVYGNSNPGDPTLPNASASGNRLTLTTGADIGEHGAYGGKSGTADVSGNTVEVDGNAYVGEEVFGGVSTGAGKNANGNSVTIGDNAEVGFNVFGGMSLGGDADGNSVTISGGAVSYQVYGGYSDLGDATGNTVAISGGTFKSSTIAGARLVSSSSAVSATMNTVTISGGTFQSAFIAGALVGSFHSAPSATMNTVTISGDPHFGIPPQLYGAYCTSGDCSGDLFSGNTLNLKSAGLTVGSLANFEFLNFYLPTDLEADDTMLIVTTMANLTNGSGKSSIINVGIDGASSALAVGDSVKLIHATTLTAAGLNTTATGAGMQGVTLKYVFGISTIGKDLLATVQGVGVSEESKALSEGFISGASFVNQGSDLASGKGMANAISAAEVGWSSFGAVSGGSIRSETGSHVDVTGVSLMAGLSGDAELSIGRLTAGVFAEYGNGSYDTFNGFSSGNVRGEGDSSYIGGGLLGHADFHAMGPGHAYAEASARLGSSHTSFSSADLVSGGVAAGYDSSSLYYGASAAVGYVWTLNEATTVDVSGKVLWSRRGGDSTQLTTGDTVDFDAVNSERTRLGARVSYALTDQITPYAGAAWEHEFDGKSRATTNGLAIDAPSMRGGTGIFEAGLTLKPSDDLPLTVDLGLQGFVGQREGIAGNLQARLAF